MARRSSTLGVLPLIGAVTGTKLLIGAGVAYLLTAKKKTGPNTPGSNTSTSTAASASNVDANAKKADANFVAALGTATGIVDAALTAASSGSVVVPIAIQAGLAIDAGVVTVLWKKLPPETRAKAWLGLQYTKTALDESKPYTKPNTPARAPATGTLGGLGGASIIPGCANPAPGFNSLVCFVAQMLMDNFHAVMLGLCHVADQAMDQLRAKGVAGLPSTAQWAKFSCDQKSGFLVALASPLGIAVSAVLLATGAVVGAINSRTTAQLASAVSGAASRVGGQVASVFKDIASGNDPTNSGVSIKKPFGGIGNLRRGGCSCEDVRR